MKIDWRPPVDSDRDVFNEKPTKEDIVASATETKGAVARYKSLDAFSLVQIRIRSIRTDPGIEAGKGKGFLM